MNNKFEDILNASLDRLAKGEDPDNIARAYPSFAARLKPLLMTARIVSRNMAVEPEASFKTKALGQFRSAVIEGQREAPKKRFHFSWRWRTSWVTTACVGLAVILAAGTTGFAAAGSMPDEPLYPVKIATEQIQTAVTPSTIGKAKLQARLAGRRIDELDYIIDKDRPEVAEELSERLYLHYDRIQYLVHVELDGEGGIYNPAAPPPPPLLPSSPGPDGRPKFKGRRLPPLAAERARELMELREMLRENNPKQEAVMHKLEIKMQQRPAPPEMRRTLQKSLDGYQQAIMATGDE